MLKNLKAEMIRNSITGEQIKITEKSQFTWSEVKTIRDVYFPKCNLEYLFMPESESDKLALRN
mgnify:CR=1 FL=1